jgi:putative effector of murein hydrolase
MIAGSTILDPVSVGVALTVCAYAAGLALHRRAGLGPLVNPTLTAILIIAMTLFVTDTPYASYMRGGGVIHFVLGLAVVLLAVPLVEDGRRLARATPVLIVAILVALPFGAAVGAATAMAFGADLELVHSLLTRTITAGVSGTTAERIGGLGPLAGVSALLTGVATAAFGPPLLKRLGVRTAAAYGLTMGAHGHAIAAGQAGLTRPESQPYARLAMAACTVAGAVMLPQLQTMEGRMLRPQIQPAHNLVAVLAPVAMAQEHMPWITGSGIAWANGAPMVVRPDPRMLAYPR